MTTVHKEVYVDLQVRQIKHVATFSLATYFLCFPSGAKAQHNKLALKLKSNFGFFKIKRSDVNARNP
jgi:hypothetical protein